MPVLILSAAWGSRRDRSLEPLVIQDDLFSDSDGPCLPGERGAIYCAPLLYETHFKKF